MNNIPSSKNFLTAYGLTPNTALNFNMTSSKTTAKKDENNIVSSMLAQVKKASSNSGKTFDAAMELSKIAAATTPAQVKNLASLLNAKISRLKTAGASDDVIKKIKNVMKKASEKIVNLNQEEQIAKKAKIAEELKNLKESRKITETLSHRKANRKMKELDDVKNADAIADAPDDSNGFDISSDPALADIALSTAETTLASDTSVNTVSDASVNILT